MNNVVVIDNGTGYTKMGYAGNPDPNFTIPTVIAERLDNQNAQISRLKQPTLDFHIGDDAYKNQNNYNLIYPMKSGIIEDWEIMEKFWHRSIFNYLNCDPEKHIFILTEPPMNKPENREKMAEIFFETFNCEGLYIGVQAVLAMISNVYIEASIDPNKTYELTGTVLDSGDGCTHVIPIADGYVIGSCIKQIPIAGRDITNFYAQILKDRNENIPQNEINLVAKNIKEKYGYMCKDGMLEEFAKFDKKSCPQELSRKFKKYEHKQKQTQISYPIEVGYEQFLGPESLFQPQFLNGQLTQGIDHLIDSAIQGCPIEYRKKLYNNIVLSGGNTLFNNFEYRLEKQIQERVDQRLEKYKKNDMSIEIKVHVGYNPNQRYSVWQGGSILSTSSNFPKLYHTRQKYNEYGPSIARHNQIDKLD